MTLSIVHNNTGKNDFDNKTLEYQGVSTGGEIVREIV